MSGTGQATVLTRRAATVDVRKVWLQTHLWLGLALGVFLSVIGVTGSALVFFQEIDEALNPALRVISAPPAGKAAWRSLEEIAEAARRAIPSESRLGFCYWPEKENEAFLFYYTERRPGVEKPDTRHIFVDPYTAKVTGTRLWYSSSALNSSFIGFIFKLHYQLLVPEWGDIFVGVIAILAFVSTVTGIILWWPKNGQWRKALTLKWPAKSERLHFDLHRLSGFYLTPVALAILLSGVYFNLPDQFRAAVELFSPVTRLDTVRTAPQAGAYVSVDAAVAALDQAFPGGRVYGLRMPNEVNGVYVFYQLFPIGWGLEGRRVVALDRFRGEFLHVSDPLSGDGDGFVAWQWPLHSGYVLGWPGRIAVFLFGLSWPLIFYTGVIRWLHKRRAKRIHDERALACSASR